MHELTVAKQDYTKTPGEINTFLGFKPDDPVVFADKQLKERTPLTTARRSGPPQRRTRLKAAVLAKQLAQLSAEAAQPIDGQRVEQRVDGRRRQHRETVDDERKPARGGRGVEEAGGDAEELSSGELAQQ